MNKHDCMTCIMQGHCCNQNIWSTQGINKFEATLKALVSRHGKVVIESISLSCGQVIILKEKMCDIVHAMHVVSSIISILKFVGFSKEKDFTLKSCPSAYFAMSGWKQVCLEHPVDKPYSWEASKSLQVNQIWRWRLKLLLPFL